MSDTTLSASVMAWGRTRANGVSSAPVSSAGSTFGMGSTIGTTKPARLPGYTPKADALSATHRYREALRRIEDITTNEPDAVEAATAASHIAPDVLKGAAPFDDDTPSSAAGIAPKETRDA